MKKKWAILTIFVCAALSFALACCGKEPLTFDGAGVPERNDTLHAEGDWREKIVTRQYRTTGEGVTVDGAFSAGEWDDVYPMRFSDAEVQVELFTRFGSDGLYAAYRITDDEFYYHPKREDYCNSGVDLYLALPAAQKLDFNVLQIRCDTVGTIMTYCGVDRDAGISLNYYWTKKYLPVFGNTVVTGGLTGDDEQGYGGAGTMTIEMFVAWHAFDIEEAPETVKLYPHYNYTNTAAAGAPRVDAVEPFGTYDQPKDYYTFDGDGYVNADERIAVGSAALAAGDGGQGLAKSSAWDFSDAAEGVVRTVGARDKHYLFFKGVDASSYIVSAQVKHDDAAYGDTGPRTGLIAAMINTTKSDTTRRYSAFVLGCSSSQKTTVRTLDEPNWIMSPNRSLAGVPGNVDPTANFVKLTLVKLGGSFHYFVNDTYIESIGSRELMQFGGAAVPGLMTIGSNSTFKDISATTDETEIRDFLKASGVVLVSVQTGLGGAVAGRSDVSAFTAIGGVLTGGSVTLNVRPTITLNSVFATQTILIDGRDRTAELRNGVVMVDNVTEDVHVQVTFRRVAETTPIAGEVLTNDLSLPVTIQKLASISDKTVTEVYDYTGLKAGEPGLASFAFALPDGVYRLRVNADTAYITVENDSFAVVDETGNKVGDGKTLLLVA